MRSAGIRVAPVLLIAMMPSALGIFCFNCSSYDSPECAGLMANDTASPFYVNCTEPSHAFCRKTVITIIDSDKYVRVTRSCGFVLHKEAADNCYETDDAFKFERSCQCFQDGCNASATARCSSLAAAAALAALWLSSNRWR